MKISNREIKNIVSSLSDEFRHRPGVGIPADGSWQAGVMRSVQAVGPHGRTTIWHKRPVYRFGDLGSLAWRLMPAALVLLLLVSAINGLINNSLQYQITGLFTADPVGIYDITSFFYGV